MSCLKCKKSHNCSKKCGKSFHICGECGKLYHECGTCGSLFSSNFEIHQHLKNNHICGKTHTLSKLSIEEQLAKCGFNLMHKDTIARKRRLSIS